MRVFNEIEFTLDLIDLVIQADERDSRKMTAWNGLVSHLASLYTQEIQQGLEA